MSNLEGSSMSTPITSSNIGFQLLKKQGWKEGTGLGVSEQGRLEPVQTYLKKNKRGLGAEVKELQNTRDKKNLASDNTSDNTSDNISKKSKAKLSKKMRKAQELEKKLQEKEFERAFFREFWPDNV